MALSSGMRNRLVGFAIVISAVIILLPLVLSKDVLQRQDPQAIAINSQGAVYDENGKLQNQSAPDIEHVLNINSNNQQASANNTQSQLPTTNTNTSDANLAEAASDNSVEMLEFSSGAVSSNSNISMPPGATTETKPQVEETLVAQPAKKSEPKEEVLTAQKPASAEPPKPPISSSKPANTGPKVVAGSKPTGKFTIQVGVFSQKSNADNVIKKITGAGINAHAVEINSNGRVLYRVYAGSSNNRNELNSVLKTVDKLCGTKGRIVSN